MKDKEPEDEKLVAIKGVNKELWRRFKAECVLHEQFIGERLNFVLMLHLDE